MADPTTPQSSRIPSARGANVEPFKGDRENSAFFLQQFRNNLRLNSTRYPDDITQISYFLSLFKDQPAQSWAAIRLKEIDEDLDNPDLAPDAYRWPTLTRLIEQFKEDWNPLDLKQQRRAQLESISQTGDYKSIDVFITAFDTIAAESGYDDDTLLYFFKKALNTTLVDKISNQHPIPANYKEYRSRAIMHQHAWEQRKAEKARWTSHTTTHTPSRSSTTTRQPAVPVFAPVAHSQPLSQGVPMEVDALIPGQSYVNRAPLQKLTDAQRQYLRDHRGCFKCRQVNVDHIARNCPTNASVVVRQFMPDSSSTSSVAPAADPISSFAAYIRSLAPEARQQAANSLKDVIPGLDF